MTEQPEAATAIVWGAGTESSPFAIRLEASNNNPSGVMTQIDEISGAPLQTVAGGAWPPSAGRVVGSIFMPLARAGKALESIHRHGNADDCQFN